jgi:hypothetical protein
MDFHKKILRKVENDSLESRKRLQSFTQVLEASISNLPAPKEDRGRIIYSSIGLPIKVEVDEIECRKRLQCFTQVF